MMKILFFEKLGCYRKPHRKLGTKYSVVLCAGSTLLLVEDALTSYR
jgi:hypothetical protein